jgi:photosystem II stability/assembly factor-like uncharacterized protein
MHKLLLTTLVTFFTATLFSQKIEILTSGTRTSIRGLSVVNDECIWVSGSSGTVGKSLDGGKNWEWITVKGFEKRDFRDIEAFDKKTAIIIAIDTPAHILKTTDGGKNWKIVFTDRTPGMFLDAMDFFDKNHGIVIGDPIKGNTFIAATTNKGESWIRFANVSRPNCDSGEAYFASSGTNITYFKNKTYKAVSGGLSSHLQDGFNTTPLPILQGKESTGANSIAAWDKDLFVIVGGDFAQDKNPKDNCVLTTDGGLTFKAPKTPPAGYRSCVEFISKKQLIACGTSGVDISDDTGNTWRLISTEGFHVCQKAKSGKAVFLAGGNGKIGILRQ